MENFPHTQKKQQFSALYAWTICGLGAIFYCYEYLLRISPSIMATDLMRAYRIDAATFGNLAAFYYYAYTPMQLPVGVLMDRFGPRRLLIFACLVCAIGTYMFAEASPQLLWMAKLGRFLVGFGSAFAFIGVLKLATLWLPPQRFALIAGLTTTLGMIGAMIGDISLAALIKVEGWRNILLHSAIVGILLAIIISLIMPEAHGHKDKSDQHSWQDFKVLIIEILKIFKKPYIWLNGLVGCFLYLTLSTFAELWGVPYLETSFHYSRTEAADLISLVFLGWAVGGPLIGWISDKLRRRCLPLMICSIATTVFLALLLYVPGFQRNGHALLLFLIGIASSGEIIIFAIAREMSTTKLAATTLAFSNMLVMFGGMLLQPVVGVFLDFKWNGLIVDNLHIYSAADYRFALTAIPIGTALAIIGMLFMKETHARPLGEDTRRSE